MKMTQSMKSKLALLASFLALTACASTADIDMSKYESTCGQQCSANYGKCSTGFTMTPFMQQHACVEALRFCAQSCPARGTPAAQPAKGE